MELESIIKQEEIDRLNEAVNLARDLEYRLDKIKEQVFKMSRKKEPERLVNFWDIFEVVKSEYPDITVICKTEKQKNYANKVMAISRLMILADYYNDGWQPDWDDAIQSKWTAFYNFDRRCIELGTNEKIHYIFPPFKSWLLLNTAIENNREIFEAALK